MKKVQVVCVAGLLAVVVAACGGGGTKGEDVSADVGGDQRGLDLMIEDAVRDHVRLQDVALDELGAEDAPDDSAELPETRPDDTSTDDAPGETTDTWQDGLDWGLCPSYISQHAPGARCAAVSLPLDHSRPEDAQIDVYVYRVKATQESGKRQIWFLQGGPGGSGADFAPIFAAYSFAHPEWDLLSLDHRGVGNSARLTCPQEKDNSDFDAGACYQALDETWGEGLMKFTTTEAARDLGVLVERLREPDVPIFVYGGSYGTYWALRYVRLYPEQADGVILDSICSPGACRLDEYDENFNKTGRKIMEACADDATCMAHLGSISDDPWAVVTEVFQKVDEGTLCGGEFADVLDRPTLRMLLAMLAADFTVRPLIPALIYRLHRCDQNDKVVLLNFYTALQGMMGGMGLYEPLEAYEDLAATATLGAHIINSELLGSRSLAEVLAIVHEAYFSADASVAMVEIAESGLWQAYPDDGHMNRFGQSSTPLLMMNGTLDPQTTLEMAQPTGDYYTGPAQTFVTFPDVPHGVLFTSVTQNGLDDLLSGTTTYLLETCGFGIFEQFISAPDEALDLSCVSSLALLDFSTESPLNSMISSYLLGTDDMYDGMAMWSNSAIPPRPISPFRMIAR